MKNNLSKLLSTACLLVLLVTGGFAQGLNTVPPSPVVIAGSLITTNITSVIQTEYAAQEAIKNVSVEESPAWVAANNRMLLLQGTEAGYTRFGDLEQAIIAAYSRYAKHFNRNISSYTSDPDYQFLVGLLTQ